MLPKIPPRIAPSIPKTIDPNIPPWDGAGSIIFASVPIINPNIIQKTMFIIAIYYFPEIKTQTKRGKKFVRID